METLLNPPRQHLVLIVFSVITAHLIAIICMVGFGQATKVPHSNQKMIVQTIQLSSPRREIADNSTLSAPKVEQPLPSGTKKSEIPEIVKQPEAKPEPLPPKPENPPVAKKPAPKVEPVIEKAKPQPAPTPKPPAVKPAEKPNVKTPPKPSPSPKPKEKEPPAAPKKPETVSPSKQDIAAEAAKNKKKALLAEAQKKISQIPSITPSTSRSAATTPASPGKLEALGSETLSSGGLSQKLSYDQELANRLKLLLKLPQYGEVEIALTLNRAGKFIKLQIISAENSTNRQHVEKNLPTLAFPPFGNSFTGEDQHTFRIKLGNEPTQKN